MVVAETDVGGIFVWGILLIALLAGGFLAVGWVRKWLSAPEEGGGGVGFTLGDLRELHKRGQMSDEEFERARSKMVDAAKVMAAKQPPVIPPGRQRPQPPGPGK